MMNTYIFFRKEDGGEYFYPVEYKNDTEAKRGAEVNIGTVRVEDIDGKVIWTPTVH